MPKAACVHDYRALAQRRLPRFLFEYIDGGSYDEVTLANNVADLRAVELRQRILRDVSTIDVSTRLFSQELSMPVVLGPIGLAGLTSRRGEVQAARAAQAAGIPFTLSTVSACSLNEVTRRVDKPIWLQLYVMRDRGFVRELLAQARARGCNALLLTVDMPVPGARYRDYRSGLAGDAGLRGSLRRSWQALCRPHWLWDVGVMGRPHHLGNVAPMMHGKTGLNDFFGWVGKNFDASVTWRDLDFIREHWSGTLILKGVLDADDAREAVRLGVDGIVVSNHGGRQLDGVPSTARALPRIADAVAGQLTVLADGGIRSGLDVIRMLALGAQGVLLGRAWAFALAGGGEAGVVHVLQLIQTEMRAAMALTGCSRVADINRSITV